MPPDKITVRRAAVFVVLHCAPGSRFCRAARQGVTIRAALENPVNHALLEDGILIDLIARQRDEQALSALYDRYSRLVYSIAVHLLGDSGRAEEVTLDVFMRVWEKAGVYDPQQAKVQTWLVSMARNRAIDMLRRQRVRPEGSSTPLDEVDHMLASGGLSPEQAAQQALEADRVQAALAELPAEQRQVILLAYFRGYSQSQIAAELGLPLGTVKTRARLAMEKLRQLLQAW
ncbi:MAG: sigma-70 family RNA polymerase sigma factor [Anaerolineae bacterium]